MRVAERIYHRIEQLDELDRLIASAPLDAAPAFERACALEDLGWSEEAAAAYQHVLALDAGHAGALTNLGLMLLERDAPAPARPYLERAAELRPKDPNVHVNIGRAFVASGEDDAARRAYERGVALDPGCAPAHQGLAECYERAGDQARAAAHFAHAFAQPTCWVLPYRGSAPPVRVLLLVSARGGDLVTNHFLDDEIFQTYMFAVETYRDGLTLPDHDVVFCAIGDADRAPAALVHAARITAASGRPLVNDPARVAVTGRAENARRFAGRSGLVVPRTEPLARPALTAGELERRGWRFPLLLRSPGFHAGRNFAFVADRDALAGVAAQLPGNELLAIAFHDVRNADGRVRKYRLLFVDGAPYPVHLAVGTDWKIHYFSAEMHESSGARDEERRFLDDPAGALGERAWTTVIELGAELGLDYAGIDFALDAGGDIVPFEANATMAVYAPPPDDRWAYRRASVARIVTAVRALLLRRAGRPEPRTSTTPR